MSEVKIRPSTSSDLTALMAIDHSCPSDYVWQMEPQREEGQSGAVFREIRLPRTVTVVYPRPVTSMSETWNRRSGFLVAALDGQVAGYVRMNDVVLPHAIWITDVVVAPRFRRQGIGTTLILAAQAWGLDRHKDFCMLEMPSKNHAAVRMAQKLGYEFCGYNDRYYETRDIALFFGRPIH
jgi:ribosomal protein S18 acetylase RimI-like enzyme